MKLRARGAEDPEVNLTSLIDVVLLLLVFFMVSTSFVREAELKIELPDTQAAPAPAEIGEVLQITVTAQGSYLVNDQALLNNRPDTLRRALIKTVGDKRDHSVTIRADARATHQSVVTALDVAGRLGFTRINIATVNEAGPDD